MIEREMKSQQKEGSGFYRRDNEFDRFSTTEEAVEFPLSLDSIQLVDGEEMSLHEKVAGEAGSSNIDESIDIERSMRWLRDNEPTVIILRYYGDMTLRQIGSKLNLSVERIRRIEHQALRKMKKSTALKNYK
jgi:RNA polymerase sigma factor (sigma-70 family)